MNDDQSVDPSDNPVGAMDGFIRTVQDEELRNALQVIRKHILMNNMMEDRAEAVWAVDTGATDDDRFTVLFGIAWV